MTQTNARKLYEALRAAARILDEALSRYGPEASRQLRSIFVEMAKEIDPDTSHSLLPDAERVILKIRDHAQALCHASDDRDLRLSAFKSEESYRRAPLILTGGERAAVTEAAEILKEIDNLIASDGEGADYDARLLELAHRYDNARRKLKKRKLIEAVYRVRNEGSATGAHLPPPPQPPSR